jgi:hypothetical protein
MFLVVLLYWAESLEIIIISYICKEKYLIDPML